MNTAKTTLIVTGVARSGTTALAELLNAHPGICLGIERFKFQFLRAHNFDAGLFDRDRFFDFRKEDTNLIPSARPAWQPVYDAIAEKWENAPVIGDKVPDMMPVLADFMAANPGFKYICILRNLKDVGLSWQARANRTRDAWPKGKGFVQACESWDEQYSQLEEITANKATRGKILLLDYDEMYADPDQTEAAILGYLNLPKDPGFRETLDKHAEFAAGRPNRKVPKPYVEAYKGIDMTKARNLRKLARKQAAFWSGDGSKD